MSSPRFLSEPDPQVAWLQFVEASMPTIDRAASRATFDEDMAGEVAAEVLARLRKDWPAILQRFEAGEGRADFFVWLAVVSRNLAVDILRQRLGRWSLPRPIARLPRWQQRLWSLVLVENRSLMDAGRCLGEEGLLNASAEELARGLHDIESALSQSSGGRRGGPKSRVAQPGQIQNQGEVAATDTGHGRPSNPLKQLQERQTHAALDSILGEFTTEERFLIRAYFLEGGTASGVATAAGIGTAAHVYERIKGIMQKLRRLAEVQGLGAEDCGPLANFDWQAALRAEGEDSNG